MSFYHHELVVIKLLSTVVSGILALLMAPLFPMIVAIPASAFATRTVITVTIRQLASVARLQCVIEVDTALAFGSP